MKNFQEQTLIQFLGRIKDILFRQSGLKSLDVLNGEMGIAVFFSHYSRYTNVEVYSDYAIALISNIQSYLSLQNPVNFIHELCQMGIGIEYLLQEKYFDADPEILSDFDDIIYQVLTDKYLYLSINNVVDIGKYILSRRNNPQSKCNSVKNIKKVVDLINMHIIVEPLCFREIIDLLYCFSTIYPSKNLKRLLEGQLHLFHQILMKDDSLRWSLTFLRASKYSEKFSFKSNEINKNIYENPSNYFDYKSDNLVNGNTGYLIWLLLTEQNINETDNEYINRLFKDSFSTFIPESSLPNLGILNGYAGVGLTLLALLDKKHLSWLNLL